MICGLGELFYGRPVSTQLRTLRLKPKSGTMKSLRTMFALIALSFIGNSFVIPEYELNLLGFVHAMKAFHKRHHRYAAKWTELRWSLICGIAEKKVKPTKYDITFWKSPFCKYGYRLLDSSADTFRIEAVDGDGHLITAIDTSTSEDNFWQRELERKIRESKR